MPKATTAYTTWHNLAVTMKRFLSWVNNTLYRSARFGMLTMARWAHSHELAERYARLSSDLSTPMLRRNAILNAEFAVASDPDWAPGYKALGIAYMRAWRWQDAKEAFLTSRGLGLLDADLLAQLGDAAFHLGEWQEALDHTWEALQLNPLDLASRARRAVVLSYLDQSDEAKAEIETALLIESNHAPTLAALGYLLTRQGKFSEARAVLEQAISDGAADGTTYLYLANVLLTVGELRGALQAAHYAQQLYPPWDEALDLVATIEERLDSRYS